MRLIALISWYDEELEWLAQLAHGLATAGADHIVALDGAYAAYPEGKATADPAQGHALVTAAVDAGIGVTIHIPPGPWEGGELEKRTALFALGHSIATPGEDWLWVTDGDEVITEAPDLRARLEATPNSVASVTLWEGSEGTCWNVLTIRKLFRAQPSGITVQGHHAHYINGDGDTMWNPCRPMWEVPAEPMHDVRIQHRPGQRPAYRQAQRTTYYERCRDLQLERLG